jgi:hypothetical protein
VGRAESAVQESYKNREAVEKRFPAELASQIHADLQVASDAMWDRADELGYPLPVPPTVGHYANPEAVLDKALTSAFRRLCMLAESTDQRECLRFITEFNSKNGTKFGSVDYDADSDGITAIGLDEASEFLASLEAVARHGEVLDVTAFGNILGKTATIVLDSHTNPGSEKSVRDEIFRVLKYAYPDLMISKTIAHPGKNYVPDFYSGSAQSLAEFKFARNRTELKAAYDGLLVDMRGYSGDETIKFKYAVIYLTNPFASQSDADAHFASLKKPDDWIVILQHGPSAERT